MGEFYVSPFSLFILFISLENDELAQPEYLNSPPPTGGELR